MSLPIHTYALFMIPACADEAMTGVANCALCEDRPSGANDTASCLKCDVGYVRKDDLALLAEGAECIG